MDVEPGFNEGNINVADAEQKRFYAERTTSNDSLASKPSNLDGAFQPFGKDGLTFGDLLDLINPLQHIPIVSTFYRAITGDELSPAARIAGGTLFGGPIGLVAAVTNTTVQAFSGRDIGETLFASAFGESNNGEDAVLTVDPASSNETQLAASDSRGDGLPISLLPSRPTDQTAAAHTPETAPYLAPHPARSTQAAGSASEPLPRTIAVAKKPQPEPLSSTTASMPSSLLAMANAGIPGQPDGPISALLQARAAVPSSGRIPGLGSIVSNRVEPPVHAAAVSPTNLVQAQNLALEATQPPALPSQLASRPTATVSNPTAAVGDVASSQPASITSTAPLVLLGQSVSSSLVPRAMMDALDKYEALKQQPETTATF